MVLLRSSRGLTLIELLVSMVILVVGLVSLSTLFLGGLQINRWAQNVSVANQAAQLVLERARDLEFAEVETSDFRFASGDAEAVDDPAFENMMATLVDWQRTVTITPYPDADSLFLKQVTVELRWGGSQATQSVVNQETLVAGIP